MLFLYRLALKVGRLDVWKLAQELTVADVLGWMAYYEREPFGDEWRATARLCLLLRHALGVEVTQLDEEKFLPTYRPPVQTESELIAELSKIPAFADQLRANGKLTS